MRPDLLRTLAALTSIALFGAAASLPSAPRFDWIIANAEILDGTGAPPLKADIGIAGDTITEIGDLSRARARSRIDAKGALLSPGIIDIHTHIEAPISRHPDASNFLSQGVTTIVTGNCGRSVKDVGRFLSWVDRGRIAVNIGTLVGHDMARLNVVGPVNRHATPDEITQMTGMVEQSMREGALGISTGLSYVPGSYASLDEVRELVRAAGKWGGIHATHLRSEGLKMFDAMEEIVRITRETRTPLQISHLKLGSRKHWGKSSEALARLAELRKSGIPARADFYPFDASSTQSQALLPDWALEGGIQLTIQKMADSRQRQRAITEMVGKQNASGFADFAHIRLTAAAGHPEWIGKEIPALSDQLVGRRDPASQAETLIRVAEAEGDRSYISLKIMNDADIEVIGSDPDVMLASDASIPLSDDEDSHPRVHRNVSEFVRRFAKSGLLGWPEAIRKMTSLPAETLGIRGRGLIRKGYKADLALWNADRSGVDSVWVNGIRELRAGQATGERGGRAIRRIPR